MNMRLFLLFGVIVGQTACGMDYEGAIRHPANMSPGDRVESHLTLLPQSCLKQDIQNLLRLHRRIVEERRKVTNNLNDLETRRYQEYEKARSNKIKYFSIGFASGLVVSLVGLGIRSYASTTANSPSH